VDSRRAIREGTVGNVLRPIVGLVFGLGGAPEGKGQHSRLPPSNYMKDLCYDTCGLPAGVSPSSD
jgi:hypothetical protein